MDSQKSVPTVHLLSKVPAVHLLSTGARSIFIFCLNYSLTQQKLALSNKDDKRVWFDKTSSRAYGHWRNEKQNENE